MRRITRAAVAALVLGVLPAVSAVVGGPAPVASATANDYQRGDLRLLTDNGSRFDWGIDNNIYFDRPDGNGWTDVWKVSSGGGAETCITCTLSPLNKMHGNARLRPDGTHRWLVFQREKATHGFAGQGVTVPGVGIYNDIWVKDMVNNLYYELHSVNDGQPLGETPGGTLLPFFNEAGTKLMWTDRTGPGADMDNLRVMVADFTVNASGVPSLTNKTPYLPTNNGLTNQWREASGWSLDGSWVHFSCADQPGMYPEDMDVCCMNFATPNAVTRLTQSSGVGGEPREWDEHMKISPLGDAMAWMTSRGQGPGYTNPTSINQVRSTLKTDVWIANVDGTSARRLTYFNDPKHADWLGYRAIPSELHWNTAGTQLAMRVQTPDDPAHTDRIFVMDLFHGVDTGWKNPSANVGTGFETTPTNAYADGGGTANNINGQNQAHQYYNYNLGVPAGATVKRIEVRLDWRADNASASPRFDVNLSWNGGTSWTATKATAAGTTTEATYTVASPLSHAFTQAELSDTNFRLGLTMKCASNCGTRDWFLDWAAAKVIYTP